MTLGQDLIELTLVDRSVEADDVVALRFATSGGTSLPTWDPGAHIDVHTPLGLRQYSLCGSLAERDTFQIGVLRETSGRGGSLYLHDRLRPGDRLLVSRPRNNFRIVPAARYLFIAGGIGITPILPMLEAAEAMKASWRLLYLARSSERFAFTDRLSSYGGRVAYFTSDTGSRADLKTELEAAETDTQIFSCGPERLLADLERVVEATGRSMFFHSERFMSGSRTPSLDDRPFRMNCRRTGVELDVPVGTSALDVLLKNDIFVPTSCTQGICGSCETTVLGGIPEHHDSILSNAERAAGDRMYVCVSRAASDRLDLDV